MALLQYDISVVGLRNVDAAFAHVERRARASNARLAGGGPSSPVATAARATGNETRAREQSERRMAASRERTARRIAQLERSAAVATEKEREAIRKRSEASIARAQQRQMVIESAHRTRMARAEAASKARQELTEQKRLWRAEEAEARRKLAMTRAARLSRENESARFQSAVGARALGAVGSVGRAALGTAVIGGTALVGNALMTQSGEATKASQLANQVGDPSRKGEILAQAQSYTGFTGGEVLDSLKAWTEKTGDMQAGLDIMREMSELALATGTNLEDMGRSAGAMFNPLADAIEDPKERLEALKRTLRMYAGAGAIGTIELENMATEGAAFAAQASRFAGGPEETMKVLNAAAQAAARRGGAENAAEAATALGRFGSDVITKQKKLKDDLGIDIFTDSSKTQMRGYGDLIKEVISKSGGRLDVIGDIFGERGAKMVQGFQPLYAEAERKKKGSGAAAVQAEFDKYLNATLTDQQIKERVASRTEDPDIQFKETMKELNAELGSAFLPIMQDLVKALRATTPEIVAVGKGAAAVAQFMLSNPFGSMSGIVTAALVKEIAAARIGDAIANSMKSGANFDLKLAGAAIAITAATLTVEKMADARDAAVGNAVKGDIEAANVRSVAMAQLRNKGGLDKETRKKLEAYVIEQEKLAAQKPAPSAAPAPPGAFGGGYGPGAASGADVQAGAEIAKVAGAWIGELTDYMGLTTGQGFEAQATAERKAERAGSGTTSKDVEQTKAILAMAEAAKKQADAADKLGGAADKLGGASLNRGPAPSPVK